VANDYRDIDVAKAVVTNRYGAIDDGELEALLEASACKNTDGETVYRPYLVAAHLIKARWAQYKRLRSAAGSEVEYDTPHAAFDALTSLQDHLTVSLGLVDCPAWSGGHHFIPVF
jgi:hypothetical protein